MTETIRVMIADDHPVFRDGLALRCSSHCPRSRWLPARATVPRR